MKTKYFEYQKNISDEDLKKQFRELSKKLHPDMPEGSEETFTEMMAEYEAILKQRSGKTIEGIRQRIREELNDFYTRIAPELNQYKPEFLQLYDDLFVLADKAIDKSIGNLAQRLKIPAALTMIAKKYIKTMAKQKKNEYRKKIENI